MNYLGSWLLTCGCWKDNEYTEEAVGKLCAICLQPFRKKKLKSIRLRMLQIPKIKIAGELKITGELSDKSIKQNEGYIAFSVNNRTKYKFDARSNKVIKEIDSINKSGEFDKQPDVYEYFTNRKYKKKL